ncbi:MAG TPA: hypothetical protein VFQ41_00700 [Candidatus Angelobacter sp.]|nr:hypothetical protein [Candidatus Angelobacter sp.]
MKNVRLKLKQASAVLGVSPKELQNLVQFGVLRPSRRNGVYWFDAGLLLQAKVAFYLKDSLGSSSDLLARFTTAVSQNLSSGKLSELKDVSLRSRPASGKDAVEIRIPLRSLGLELEKQLPRAGISRDLPRGPKRAGWKKDFLRSLEAAAAEMGDVSEEEILKTVKETREMLARRKRTTTTSALEELTQSSERTPPRRRPSSARKKLPEITVVARTKTKTA